MRREKEIERGSQKKETDFRKGQIELFNISQKREIEKEKSEREVRDRQRQRQRKRQTYRHVRRGDYALQ